MKTLIIRSGERLTIRAIAGAADENGRDRCATLAFFQEHARLRPKEFAWDGITSEIQRRSVQAFTAADPFGSSPRVAIPIELTPPRRPPVLHVMLLVIKLEPSCPFSGSTAKRGENPSDQSNRDAVTGGLA